MNLGNATYGWTPYALSGVSTPIVSAAGIHKFLINYRSLYYRKGMLKLGLVLLRNPVGWLG